MDVEVVWCGRHLVGHMTLHSQYRHNAKLQARGTGCRKICSKTEVRWLPAAKNIPRGYSLRQVLGLHKKHH